ncbi:RNA polymerase sigma factor SigJ [Streptomyces griseiscabiei]|uniref:RNA polymerase sigma factor SigJ n=1 Tax=Streptomyces griseiscabiei TaxID=2993540 RepID=A0ABU4L3H1_9ACTN|nr:RNA polymerase sigma factor SigJ [Streptomyces griseiscabiei]MBZ3901199.1 RNA polymerase sigma factor SigJ [Streptomyces griseiscabiei]MDX2910251.1 RNA polymerase sigma factor SigJ [Streptomyces griseiscabiei]
METAGTGAEATDGRAGADGTDDLGGWRGAAHVAGERGQLVNVAYRLLGSATEAEDAVQDAYARWYALPGDRQAEILSPGAWLTTVTGRICLDLLGSARARRERYVGAWLPEPLPDRTEWEPAGGDPVGRADPADQIVLDESVTMAFLVVLESMTPAERVAFVLHDVFRYPFAEIAAVLGRTPAACKQLAASARRRLNGERAAVTATGRAEVVRQVKEAWQSKDIAALVALLDPAAVMTADGGGLVGTVLHPVEGGARIARYLLAIADKAPGLELLEHSVNGTPGLVARRDGRVVTVAAFDLADGRVTRVWAVRNPEKLRPWTR